MTTPEDRPVLPDRTSDETDEGWGERLAGAADVEDRDVERLLAERPPHHDRG